ncbi:MAG: Crp/Fnr family transcriptional regulator [Candidatus Cybelea sp.]
MREPILSRHPTGNLFLDHLSERAIKALSPPFVSVSLKHSELVNDDQTASDRVLFPVNSVVSVVLDMSNGDTAEVGIIGREGMTGLAIVLGQASVNQRSIVQIPDSAMCIPIEVFRAALESVPELKAFALRYAQAVLMASGRLSACNALHPTTERCARWLLMAHDRVDGGVLLLTQEFLGQMLGVRRASVALAEAELQTAGFISYSRGHIKIHNRAGLESAACECYEAMDDEWKATMGYSLRMSALAAFLPAESLGRSDGVAHTQEEFRH